ncbi:unnamed protein product [Zymoseptoria tritici ST99CH_1A5]|uniref:Uncharacterized protein n=2 Tax=Zymoseptoria tritici TaxID=1047171 RepID=A0A1X7S7V4_ZYMT9|nr:unnamed protein product [Zymoseptoria tritici ST99CH_3D7]SMR63632.1 unnamed protein product [Zymoseptoria tritici ST99CH_3D1]SMY28994.1 unnamed protein product [Zymoseptoria tritici ST99CH_1A5]
MHFKPLLLLLGTALANPLAQLQERQAPAAPVCAAAVGKCQATPTLRVRASTWCASLGFGTAVRTARSTSTEQRTVVKTTTLFTSTSTSVAPTRTSTIISARTTTITNTATRRLTSTTTTITVRRTRTFDSCPEYTLAPNGPVALDPDTDTTSELPTSEAATTTPEQSAVTTPEQSAATSSVGSEIATSVGFETVTTAATPEQTTGAPETTAAGQQKRQVVRPSVKPACLTALNAVATTNACRCIIPSSTTTRTTTLRSTVTATRTIVTTRRTVSTVTSSPVTTITTGALLTRTVTTTITSINRVAATVTSTVAYELAATPTAFVLMDRLQAPDAAVAQWATNGADNETSHNIEYALTRNQPSVFSFNAWNELHVAGWGDDEGTDFTVVGQEQEGDGVQMAALDSDDGSQAAKCSIQVTAEGLCPVRCTVGDNAVNSQVGADKLWVLLGDGDDSFTNYLYSAEDGWQDAQAMRQAN